MGCKYAYYKDEKVFYPKLYCRINDKICPYVKRCTLVERFIQIDNFNEKECREYIMEQIKNIPKDSYYIQTYRPNKQGKLYLYVVINESIEKIPSDFTEINQNYVYLKKDKDKYIVSLTPFVEKKTYNKKGSNYKKEV